jgi:hypothetical protein
MLTAREASLTRQIVRSVNSRHAFRSTKKCNVINSGRDTITYKRRSEIYYAAGMMERIMKRMMPIPSVAIGKGPCKRSYSSGMVFITG